MSRPKKLIIIISLIFVVGVVGYHFLLDISLLDALYMTVITVSTVGFKEVGEMSDAAKIFTILLIISSLSFLAYAISGAVSMIMDGNLGMIIRRKSVNSKIAKLNRHYIICGAKETGEHAIAMFMQSGEPFVVIDEDEEVVDKLIGSRALAIMGEATGEEAFKRAQIDRAKGILLALPRDIDNVFAALTARDLNPTINIVSIVYEVEAEKKLLRAGVNKMINPNNIGGSRMASLLLKPNVISFFDVITKIGDYQLDVEEVLIEANSELDDKTLSQAEIPRKTGLKVLAIKGHDNAKMQLNPSGHNHLRAGDIMIVIGARDQIVKLRQLAGGSA